MHFGQKRVTLDLDDAVPLDGYRGYYGLLDAGAESVEIRVSSSGEGFHVRGWFDEIPDDAVEKLRLGLGDHPIRVDLDRTHSIKPDQMLFTSKPGRDADAGPWRDSPIHAATDLKKRSSRFGLARWSAL